MGRGAVRSPPLAASSACPLCCVPSSLPPTPRKSLSGKVFQVQNLGRRSFPEGSPRLPANGCVCPFPTGQGCGRRAWDNLEEDLLALRLEPSAGALGTSVTPTRVWQCPPAPWKVLGGGGPCNVGGLFSPPPRGSATSWPPVSPTHQRPAPRAPSGAADSAAGPARAPDSARSDCIPVVLAVSHGGSVPPPIWGAEIAFNSLQLGPAGLR